MARDDADHDGAAMVPALDATDWVVVEVAGDPALGRRPTVGFHDGHIGGVGGVNRYRGSYQVDDGVLSVGAVMSTMMAGPEIEMDQERRWFAALASPSELVAVAGGVELRHADGTVSRLAPAPVTVRGTVTYLARIAMPAGAVLTVGLVDTARADAASPTLAEQRITEPGTVPIAFELEVDVSALDARAVPSLRARIDVDGDLWFTTDQHHPVDLATDEPHALVLTPARR